MLLSHLRDVPLNNHAAYLKKLECFKLETALNSTPDVAPPKLDYVNNKVAVWKIELLNNKTAFMRCDFFPSDDDYYVVQVDAQKFYYLWLLSALFVNTTHRSNNCVLRKDMPNDYKFDRAVEGFSKGSHSPVPLAQVSACYVNGRPYIGFSNGVTRTMWLIYNGAKSFPVGVHKRTSAKYLHEFAGIGEFPLSCEEIKKLKSPNH